MSASEHDNKPGDSSVEHENIQPSAKESTDPNEIIVDPNVMQPAQGETMAIPSQQTPSDPPPSLDTTMQQLETEAPITLHSPSSQIIGTPFPLDSPRFEYPFPDQSSSGGDPASAGPLLSYPTTSIALTASASQPHFPISRPPLQLPSSFPGTDGPSFPPSYSPTHPKLKQATPPVPPGLVKKKQRWSLGLLARRRSSSYGSQSSEASTMSLDSVGAPLEPPISEHQVLGSPPPTPGTSGLPPSPSSAPLATRKFKRGKS